MIDVTKTSAVLLPDGKWHDVVPGSFDVDAYDYVRYHEDDKDESMLKGDKVVTTTGASWTERKGGRKFAVYCPITAVLAVRHVIKR